MSTQFPKLAEFLYTKLPAVYRNADKEQKEQLKRFLEVLADGGLDIVKNETLGLMDLFDFDKVPAKFLPNLASVLGFTFPFDLDEQTQRTYVKNAVASYKIKGTEKALLFMIRELTRFKTSIETDKVNRHIDVHIEVDLERQDFERVVEKVGFLIEEYAPPLKTYQIINTFLWIEQWYGQSDQRDDDSVIVTQYTDLDSDGWFGTNIGVLNDSKYTITAEIEDFHLFGSRQIEEEAPDAPFITFNDGEDVFPSQASDEDMSLILAISDTEMMESNFSEDNPIIPVRFYTDMLRDGWFYTNGAELTNDSYSLTAEIELYKVPLLEEHTDVIKMI